MTRADAEPELPEGVLATGTVASYLPEGERVAAVLRNDAVGVVREDGEETTIVAPAPECGAACLVTEGRVLLLVGDPDEREGDFEQALSYEDVAAVEVRDQTLTRQVAVETRKGPTWAVTASEADAAEPAARAVAERAADRHLERAREMVADAEAAANVGDRVAALEAAIDSYQCVARLGCPEAEADHRAAAERAIADLVAARREQARDERALGNWKREAGNAHAARAAYAEAIDALERAADLADRYDVGEIEAIEAERADVRERRDALDA